MELLLFDDVQIDKAVQSLVADATDSQAFVCLINLIETALVAKDRCPATIAAAWKLIVDRRLWSSEYPSLEHFQVVSRFQENILPSIQTHAENEKRVNRLRLQLRDKWPGFNNSPFSHQVRSQHSLSSLCRLSAFVEEEEGLNLLCATIEARQKRTQITPSRQNRKLTFRDIQDALTPYLEPKASANQAAASPVSSISVKPRHSGLGASLNPQTQPADGTSQSHLGALTNADGTLAPPGRRRSTRIRQASWQRSRSAATLSAIPARLTDEPDADHAVVASHTIQVAQPESSSFPPLEMPRTQTAIPGARKSKCPYCGQPRRPRIQPATRPCPNLEPLIHARPQYSTLCRKHLRALAASAGLQNNIDSKLMISRMEEVCNHAQQFESLQQTHPGWFRLCARAPMPSDELGPYEYEPQAAAPEECPLTDSTAKELFNRYAGSSDAWDRFQRDGTINIDGFFSYLTNNPAFKLVSLNWHTIILRKIYYLIIHIQHPMFGSLQ